MPKMPRTSAKIIFKHKDKILLLKTKGGIFDIPGGKIRFKETIFKALKRELKEELNYKLVKEPQLFYAWEYISKGHPRHLVYIVYLQKLNKKINFKPNEGIKIYWLTKKEIKNLYLVPEMKKILLESFTREKSISCLPSQKQSSTNLLAQLFYISLSKMFGLLC